MARTIEERAGAGAREARSDDGAARVGKRALTDAGPDGPGLGGSGGGSGLGAIAGIAGIGGIGAAGGAGGGPLPEALRKRMEASFAADLSAVRVYPSSESAVALGADAYARGNELHFAPGKYDPESVAGQELIGHELAHVLQQAGGVGAPVQARGAALHDDHGLEAEADAAGARAARGEPARVAGGGAAALGGAEGAPVQRQIATTDGAMANIQTPADVQALFARRGVHFPYKYWHAAGMIDDLAAAATLHTLTEAGAIAWIVQQAKAYEETQLDELQERGLAPGAQEIIQRKLVEICELVRAKRERGGPQQDLDLAGTGNGDAESPAWYALVVDNGLCGGWSAVHRERPQWLEALWSAVESWQPTEGLSAQAECQRLEDHLRSKVRDEVSDDPLADVIKLLRDAYRHMQRLEPTAGYTDVPDSVDVDPSRDRVGEREANKLARVSRARDLEVTKGAAGQAIVDYLREHAKKAGDYVAHVETEQHHMSVRLAVKQGGATSWAVVESEREGVVETKDANEVKRVLESGIYLEGVAKTTPVDITLYRAT